MAQEAQFRAHHLNRREHARNRYGRQQHVEISTLPSACSPTVSTNVIGKPISTVASYCLVAAMSPLF